MIYSCNYWGTEPGRGEYLLINMTTGEGNSALLKEVFPEGVMSLKEADPELYAIIKDEKHRQRYGMGSCHCVVIAAY